LTPKQEQELIINDLYLIAKAVKEHVNEPNCTHTIKFIVKQALQSKTSGLEPNTTPEPQESIEPGYQADRYA